MSCLVCNKSNCADSYFAIIYPTHELKVLDIIKSSRNTVFHIAADNNEEISLSTGRMPYQHMIESDIEKIDKDLYSRMILLKAPGGDCDNWQELKEF